MRVIPLLITTGCCWHFISSIFISFPKGDHCASCFVLLHVCVFVARLIAVDLRQLWCQFKSKRRKHK